MNLSQIDDLTRADHFYLESTDECFYMREYTSRGGYAHSDTNQLILNLKKSVERKGRPEYYYKERAIQTVIAEFNSINWNKPWLQRAVLVPIPPSRVRADPLYDDRITQIVSAVAQQFGAIARDLILQRENMNASHATEDRATPTEIAANYEIDESGVPDTAVSDIGLFDDVLTTGSHFKAAQSVLSSRFPSARIIGFFVARRVFAQPEPLPETG